MNKDDFIKMYKDTKKEEIIEELFYKCNANYKLNNIIDEFENWLKTIPNYFMDTRSLNSGIEKQNGMKYIIDLSLEKLKELKGSD